MDGEEEVDLDAQYQLEIFELSSGEDIGLEKEE